MLKALKAHGLIWPTVATTVAFAILVALGSWQMQRKAWKDALLAQIAQRTHAPPVSLTSQGNETLVPGAAGGWEYTHASARGRFLHEHEQYLWAPDPAAGSGYHVYTPLKIAEGRVIWVNRGFVPEALKDAGKRLQGQLAGEVTVTGLVREAPKERGLFVPESVPARKTYFWRSLKEMHAAAFGSSGMTASSFFIDADAEPANPGGWPKGGVTLVKLTNRHLEYALTWYGLAATLLGVYIAFVAARLRGQR